MYSKPHRWRKGQQSMETITSRMNPLCIKLRKLTSSAAYRREQGAFLCDSPKLLEEILKWRSDWLETVVFTEKMALPQLPESVRCVQVPASLMEAVSPAKTPQGVLAVCRIPQMAVPEELTGSHYVVMDTVQDPGNVGTILRTEDAFWADGVFLVNACADLYSPKTVRASMGAVLRCPVWRCTVPELTELLHRSGIPLYGAALREDTVDAREADYSRAAVAIGSEGHGLSAELLECCDKTVKIPMNPHCESLNAAAAATALLWEMARGTH